MLGGVLKACTSIILSSRMHRARSGYHAITDDPLLSKLRRPFQPPSGASDRGYSADQLLLSGLGGCLASL